jgi:hypothetical protein
LLSHPDRILYLRLRTEFHDELGKSKKGERLGAFSERLRKIRHFVDRGDEDDWKRSLVCGVFFLPTGFAIHIQQLRILLGRCKSSINGSLQQLQCQVDYPSETVHPELLAKIPPSSRDMSELKKLTIRRTTMPDESPEPQFIVPVPPVKLPPPPPPPPLSLPGPFPLGVPETVIHRKFPCPVKVRYKYRDIQYQSVSIQTEV